MPARSATKSFAVEAATHDALGMSGAEEVRHLMCDNDSDEIVVRERGEPRVAAVIRTREPVGEISHTRDRHHDGAADVVFVTRRETTGIAATRTESV